MSYIVSQGKFCTILLHVNISSRFVFSSAMFWREAVFLALEFCPSMFCPFVFDPGYFVLEHTSADDGHSRLHNKGKNLKQHMHYYLNCQCEHMFMNICTHKHFSRFLLFSTVRYISKNGFK
jgi:hypothetical protein